MVAIDPQPREQQQVEPGDVVDQGDTPNRAALAASETVQFAELRRAFEGLGFESAFRSPFAGAKARCCPKSLGQCPAKKERRVSPRQQIGGDQQRDGHDDGQAKPQQEAHQHFLSRDEENFRQLELRRVANGRGL